MPTGTASAASTVLRLQSATASTALGRLGLVNWHWLASQCTEYKQYFENFLGPPNTAVTQKKKKTDEVGLGLLISCIVPITQN
jgi:hypothetical protein